MKKQLTKDEIFVRREIERIYPQLVINARKTTTTNFDKWGLDLITTVVEFFLNKPIEQQLKTIEDKKLENMLTFMMAVQLKSTSSRFYSEFRKHTNSMREFYENYEYDGQEYHMEDEWEDSIQNEVIKCVEYHAKDLDVFEKMVYDKIIKGGETYAKISQHYQIGYNHLRDTAIQLKEMFNQKCEYCFDQDFNI